jgi:hypothetical protein
LLGFRKYVLNHVASTLNPHNVTKTQVGLSNVPTDFTSAVAANTSKVGITTQQASDITQTAKVGITPVQATAITDNAAAIINKIGKDGSPIALIKLVF